MKKVKSVKLRNGYSVPGKFIPAGTELKKNDRCDWVCENSSYKESYRESYIELYPDFFDITYEEDFFEVDNEKTEFIILADGTIYNVSGHNTSQYIQGNAGTKSEMEYRKMHNETMHYFRKLAEELNGEWRYEAGKRYNELMLQPNKTLGLYPHCDFIRNSIKFNPELTIEQITSRAKPEMLENYKKICENPY